jgi:hypothetical protein
LNITAGFSLWSIITPAIVASFITLFLNIRSEKSRAARDFVSRAFDAARDDVRRATEAAVEYYPLPASDRTAAIEARLWMGERDVRHSVNAVIEFSTAGSDGQKLLQSSFDNFIDALTGGSFQSSEAEPDLEQVRKVASAGGELRASISMARQIELRQAISSDILSRSSAVAFAYMTENLGPRSEDAPDRAP